ncbi:hypothetical protein ACA910_015172 [Epithemia clementina (nom. ined.)]
MQHLFALDLSHIKFDSIPDACSTNPACNVTSCSPCPDEKILPCYFDMKNTVIGSEWHEPFSIAAHKDPKNQFGYQIHVENSSKDYGKVNWAIGTIVLANLVIVLVIHGHLPNNFELWGAAFDDTNLLVTLLLEAIINLTTRTVTAQDTEFHIFPTYFGVLICFLLLAFHQFYGADIAKEFVFFWMTHSILSKCCHLLWLELKKTNIVCIPTKFCTFEAVWVTLKNSYHLCLSLLDNATTIFIGNNLWGNITNMYLFDVNGIFMTYHDWGDYISRNQFFDFVIHEFNLWYKTAHIVQRCAYLLGIFMSLVDWGDIYSFSLCQSNLHYPFFHRHVHQVIALVKQFTVSQLQHKTNTADTLNRFIWYVRDILPFWHEFQDSTKSTQPTHHALWGVIHFPPYGVKVVVAMRVA